jgi:hypothetical protein
MSAYMAASGATNAPMLLINFITASYDIQPMHLRIYALADARS